MKSIVRWIRTIPGFRRLSPDAMTIAAAYYIVAVYALCFRWQWGLLLLSLPFLAFSLIDLNATGRRRSLAVAAAAGLLLLLGAAGILYAGGGQSSPAAKAPASATVNSTSRNFTGPAGTTPVDAQSASAEEDKAEESYVAAKGSGVFHRPGCSSARRIKKENRIVFGTREAAKAEGLAPCKRCNP